MVKSSTLAVFLTILGATTLVMHAEEFSNDTHMAKNGTAKKIGVKFCGTNAQGQATCTRIFSLKPNGLTPVFKLHKITSGFFYQDNINIYTHQTSTDEYPLLNFREINEDDGHYSKPVRPHLLESASMLEVSDSEPGPIIVKVIPLNQQPQAAPAPTNQAFSADTHIIKNSTNEQIKGLWLCNSFSDRGPTRDCKYIEKIEPNETTPIIKLQLRADGFLSYQRPYGIGTTDWSMDLWELNLNNGLYDKKATESTLRNACMFEIYKDAQGYMNARILPLN